MNTLILDTSHNLTYNDILKTILLYIFAFLLLYAEPIPIAGGLTIGILWKIVFLAAILLPVSLYIYQRKHIEPFVLFAVLLSIKMLFSISAFDNINVTIGFAVKNLFFPLLFLFLVIKSNPRQLIYVAKHFSILIVLSFVPFMLGILSSRGESYKMESFGVDDAISGLLGVFSGPHMASESLGIALIVLFYFLQNEKNKIMKLVYIGILGLGTYELILTYARTGLLIAFVGIFYLWMKDKGSKKLTTAIIIIVPIAFMSIYMYITNPVFQMRINDETKYSKKSGQVREIGSGRPTIWKNALNNWYKEGYVAHAIGLGYEYGTIKMKKAIGNKIFAHNWYIQILQQEGLIGMMFFLLYLFYLFKYVRRYKDNRYYNISMALLLAYIAEMVVQGNFLLIMFLMLAIFLALMQKTDSLIGDEK